ncbi:MAG TPA: glycine betaine ABC transporter substrate-binding protein, partial [Acidimicrobiales bacterium]|nr:glycine betaine ABC transporter substrate-binding protein [Acidimicrobiales bacterium]
PTECPQNAFCEVGLKKVYGIKFGSFKGLEENVAVSALKSNAIQVAELFSSDGTVSANGFVTLSDNKNLQPADHIVPIILKKYHTAGIARVINGVDAKLTTSVLEQLNIAVNVNHKDAATVAKSWLITAKLIKG